MVSASQTLAKGGHLSKTFISPRISTPVAVANEKQDDKVKDTAKWKYWEGDGRLYTCADTPSLSFQGRDGNEDDERDNANFFFFILFGEKEREREEKEKERIKIRSVRTR